MSFGDGYASGYDGASPTFDAADGFDVLVAALDAGNATFHRATSELLSKGRLETRGRDKTQAACVGDEFLVMMAPKIKRFGSNGHWSPSEKKFIIIDMQ